MKNLNCTTNTFMRKKNSTRDNERVIRHNK